MRVIMLIETADDNGFENILTRLQEGVEMGFVDGYFTLCIDGRSQAKQLPDHMDSEKNLSDWVASFETLITNTQENTNATQK